MLYCKISGLVSLSKSCAGFLNNFGMKLYLFSPLLPSPPHRSSLKSQLYRWENWGLEIEQQDSWEHPNYRWTTLPEGWERGVSNGSFSNLREVFICVIFTPRRGGFPAHWSGCKPLACNEQLLSSHMHGCCLLQFWKKRWKGNYLVIPGSIYCIICNRIIEKNISFLVFSSHATS